MDMITNTMKTYLKTIFLMEEKGERVKTIKLARELQIKPASVTEMIQKIASLGLVRHKPYYGIELTEEGERLVIGILRRHRLLEKLLVDFAGLDISSACTEASKLELLLSEHAANSICTAFNHPTTCPCGKPIYRDEKCCGGVSENKLSQP